MFQACTSSNTLFDSGFKVNLDAGVPGLAELNDTVEDIKKKTAGFTPKEIEPSSVNSTDGATFSHVWNFKDLGLKVYFQKGRVSLIEIQEPFEGEISGKSLKLFTFATPPGSSWRDKLVQEFGNPVAEASGGRLSSFSLFYSWGDISFNGMGPNQIAIHRNQEMVQYRQNNFGRVVSLFE